MKKIKKIQKKILTKIYPFHISKIKNKIPLKNNGRRNKIIK